jgi:hypothetical protein
VSLCLVVVPSTGCMPTIVLCVCLVRGGVVCMCASIGAGNQVETIQKDILLVFLGVSIGVPLAVCVYDGKRGCGCLVPFIRY